MCLIIWGQVDRGVHVFNNLGPGGQGSACVHLSDEDLVQNFDNA
jgi:hypothetical protein